MGKYDGTLICSDFDCTIANGGIVSEENVRAINYFISEGGLFVLATGRQKSTLGRILNEINFNAPLALINGAILDLYGEHIYENSLPENVEGDITEILENNSVIREAHINAEELSKRYINENGKFRCTQNAQGPYYQCTFILESPEQRPGFLKKMKQGYGEKYDFDSSWALAVEMHPKESGKGNAVKILREYYGEKVSHIICVGDYENDISMLMEADEGIAVANAMESVKEVADRVTVSYEEHAIAKIISEL